MGPQPGQLETALGFRWKHQEGSVHFPLGGAELTGSELGRVEKRDGLGPTLSPQGRSLLQRKTTPNKGGEDGGKGGRERKGGGRKTEGRRKSEGGNRIKWRRRSSAASDLVSVLVGGVATPSIIINFVTFYYSNCL